MDIGDVIKFLVVLLIVVIPAISQIVAKIREAQKPPLPPVRGGKPVRPAGESFKDEIEEFLRRAAEGRQQARGAGQSRTGQAPRTKPARAPTPPPKPAEPAEPPRTVVAHVEKRLDTSEFQRRTAQLGGEVAEADDKLDARVHDVFEHQLSQFDWRTPGELEAAGEALPPSATTAAVAGIFPLLTNPEGLRQAIILNEILQRPSDRW
jgi:hypothetical protein